MKSFERGHTMNNNGVSEALAQWSSLEDQTTGTASI